MRSASLVVRMRLIDGDEMEIIWKERSRSHETCVSGVRVSVHRYIGCGDLWFTSDRYFSSCKKLDSETLDDAKDEALDVFAGNVAGLYEGLPEQLKAGNPCAGF